MTAPQGDGGAVASQAEVEAGVRMLEPLMKVWMESRPVPLRRRDRKLDTPTGNARFLVRTVLDAAAAARPAPAGEATEVERLPSSDQPDREGLRTLDPDRVDTAEILSPTLGRCPFCGSRPFTMCGVNDRTGIFVARVTCVDCNATVRGSSRDQVEARSAARDAWERRMPDTAAEAALAQARAVLRQVECRSSICQICDADLDHEEPHAPGCALAAQIDTDTGRTVETRRDGPAPDPARPGTDGEGRSDG